jgi:ribosomal-protein-alanine N-acetyltransferase
MEIRKESLASNEKLFFEMDNKAFTRPFDLPARSVEEERQYLEKSDIYLLYESENPIGFFAIENQGEKVEVKTVVVLPEYQNRGYGKILLDKIKELTKPKLIELVTHPKNTNAIVVYLKSGFEIYGWKDDYYGDGQPRVLLRSKRQTP